MAILSVNDLMTPDPVCCTPRDTIADAARLMQSEDCGAIPVVETQQDKRLVGIITDRDIVVRIVAAGDEASLTQVQQAMSTDLVKIHPGAGVEECAQLMAENRVRRMLVVDDSGRLVGIVAQADVARASAQQPDLETELADMVEEVSEPAGTY